MKLACQHALWQWHRAAWLVARVSGARFVERRAAMPRILAIRGAAVPDHGVAGPARRYTLIVAMLVTLAAVPTAGVLVAGSVALDEGEGPPRGEPPRGPQPGGGLPGGGLPGGGLGAPPVVVPGPLGLPAPGT